MKTRTHRGAVRTTGVRRRRATKKSLALASAEGGRLKQTDTDIGSFNRGYGGAYLARQVGQKIARKIFFLGQEYNAQRAHEIGAGLTLIDGGWAIEAARSLLDRCLSDLGYGFGDIRRFLVTHVHRDHFTMATVLGHEYGAEVSLGAPEKPALDLLNNLEALSENSFARVLATAGAHDLVAESASADTREAPDPQLWQYPDTWFDGDRELAVGLRRLDAVHTPGHTPGHYVFADQAGGLLFAGDHVLPTITPSIGFTLPPAVDPLGDFMASLTKVRGLPDLRILPAHGPVAPSSHARVDELLAFHERRLALSLAALDSGPASAHGVAQMLPWTRHERSLGELDVSSQAMATMETKAHLELLVARGQATREVADDGMVVFAAVPLGVEHGGVSKPVPGSGALE